MVVMVVVDKIGVKARTKGNWFEMDGGNECDDVV